MLKKALQQTSPKLCKKLAYTVTLTEEEKEAIKRAILRYLQSDEVKDLNYPEVTLFVFIVIAEKWNLGNDFIEEIEPLIFEDF